MLGIIKKGFAGYMGIKTIPEFWNLLRISPKRSDSCPSVSPED